MLHHQIIKSKFKIYIFNKYVFLLNNIVIHIYLLFYCLHTLSPLEFINGFANKLLAIPSLSVFIEWNEYDP